VVIESGIRVIHGMPMNRAVGMNMRSHMTVRSSYFGEMAEHKSVMMTGFPRPRLGGGDKGSLKGKRYRRHHHNDASKTTKIRQHSRAQL